MNLYLGLNKGRPNYRRILHPSKDNIQHFKLEISLFWVIFSLLDPDPAFNMNADPDPQNCTEKRFFTLYASNCMAGSRRGSPLYCHPSLKEEKNISRSDSQNTDADTYEIGPREVYRGIIEV
jgi:hypothetical protein